MLRILFTFLGLSLGLLIAEVFLILIQFSFRLYPEDVEFGWPNRDRIEQFSPDNELFWVKKDYATTLQQLRILKPKIIFMGDSCTSMGSYPDMTSQLLELDIGKQVTFGKVGHVGWTTYQGLAQLRRDIIPLSPEIITIYFGWNDHWRGFDLTDSQVGWLHTKVHKVLSPLRSYQLILKSMVQIFSYTKGGKVYRVPLQEFEKNLHSMVTMARSSSIRPVLITPPTSHTLGNEPAYLKERWLYEITDLIPLHQEYVNVVRTVGRELNVDLCDLEQEFKKLPQVELENSYFYSDGIHLRPEGDKMIAKLLARCFKDKGIIGLL
jgi:lysophospholipase L1-like esterase